MRRMANRPGAGLSAERAKRRRARPGVPPGETDGWGYAKATIGRKAAVADFGWIKLRGTLAWWVWGLAHIYFLIGTRNRVAVVWSWFWSHTTGQNSARLITQGKQGVAVPKVTQVE